jgi:predicted DNA-binding protein
MNSLEYQLQSDRWKNGLTALDVASRLTGMEVHLTPEKESRLNELATKTGRPADELIEDAMAGYLEELAEVRTMLDSRYDDIKSGRVRPIDGEEFFEALRRREDELLKQRPSQ